MSMLHLAVRQLLGRRAATALAVLGLLVATLGFITLVGTAQTTQATLRGDIARTWHTPTTCWFGRPPPRRRWSRPRAWCGPTS